MVQRDPQLRCQQLWRRLLLGWLFCCLIFPVFASAHTLTGTVYLGAQPMADTGVSLLDAATNSLIITTTTDSNGNYQFTLDNGNYDLSITPPAILGLSQSLVEDINIADADQIYHVVLIEPEVVVNGSVNGADGTPAAGVELAVYNRHTGMNVGIVTTGESGAYSIALAKGDYLINAQGRGAHSNIPLPEIWRIAPIVPAQTISSDITLDITLPNVSVSGVMNDTHGHTVEGAVLRTTWGWSSDGIYYLVNNNSGTIKSDSAGKFLIPLFKNATYNVSVMPATGSGLAASAVPFQLVEDDLVQNIVLNDANMLSGSVVSSTGSAFKGVDLYFYDSATSVSIGSTTTDATGHYAFPLSAGRYTVHAGGLGSNQNISMPERWYINPIAKDVVVSGNLALDLVIPTVALNVQLMDGVGRAVANTRLRYNESWTQDGVSYSVSTLGELNVLPEEWPHSPAAHPFPRT